MLNTEKCWTKYFRNFSFYSQLHKWLQQVAGKDPNIDFDFNIYGYHYKGMHRYITQRIMIAQQAYDN